MRAEFLGMRGLHGQVAGYKVKCMVAEPKGKRGRLDGQYLDPLQAQHQVRPTDSCMDACTDVFMSLHCSSGSIKKSPLNVFPCDISQYLPHVWLQHADLSFPRYLRRTAMRDAARCQLG